MTYCVCFFLYDSAIPVRNEDGEYDFNLRYDCLFVGMIA